MQEKKQHKEMWRDIYGYNGRYQVSNRGRVRNTDRKNSILTPDITRGGYHRVKLVSYDSDGKRVVKNHFIHRLVALCFVPIYDFSRDQINHIDSNPWNNDWENLEWCTNSENQHHWRRRKRGQFFQEDVVDESKLSSQQVKEIRAKYRTGNYTQKFLAEQYGVTQSAISQIVKKQYDD